MVQLKIQTNFVNLKIAIKEPSLSDCLVNCNFIKGGLLIKGALKNVSDRDCFFNYVTLQSALVKLFVERKILVGLFKNH